MLGATTNVAPVKAETFRNPLRVNPFARTAWSAS
jgi:hypothetical protein